MMKTPSVTDRSSLRLTRRAPLRLALSLCACLCIQGALPAVTLAADAGLRDADRHFQHGVTLYMEADYRGALVEFERAYELAPNGIVLFNLGETQYQLRDYAGALATFERYLADAPQTDAHRTLAESNVKELRTRVGRLRIVTVPPGAEISIDDRVVGKTPFDKPATVSIGHLTVRASAPGRPPVVRTVDIATDDDVSLVLELPIVPNARTTSSSFANGTIDRVDTSPTDYGAWRKAGWIATGLLGGGAIVVGLLARNESDDLKVARARYPAVVSTVNHLANTTKTLSIVADSLTAATLLVGGITLYSTLGAHKESGATSVAVGLGSVQMNVRF
jgi:tetratricopeptide (TPR) repeat protein